MGVLALILTILAKFAQLLPTLLHIFFWLLPIHQFQPQPIGVEHIMGKNHQYEGFHPDMHCLVRQLFHKKMSFVDHLWPVFYLNDVGHREEKCAISGKWIIGMFVSNVFCFHICQFLVTSQLTRLRTRASHDTRYFLMINNKNGANNFDGRNEGIFGNEEQIQNSNF